MEQNNIKSYLVIAQGGHCGDGYFIPMLSWLAGRNKKEAIEQINTRARVKKGKKFAILYVNRILLDEGILVEMINNYDQYLTSSNIYNEEKTRRLNIPTMVERYNSSQFTNKRIKYDNVDSVNYIKTAESFSEDYPIQRHIAPYYDGSKYVYKKEIDVHEMLREYFTVSVKNIAMKGLAELSDLERKVINKPSEESKKKYEYKKREYEVHMQEMMLLYYKLFRKDNPLGIVYDRDNHTLSFVYNNNPVCVNIREGLFYDVPEGVQDNIGFTFYKNHSGERQSLEDLIGLNSDQRSLYELVDEIIFENSNYSRNINYLSEEEINKYTSSGKEYLQPSQIDKFNKKWGYRAKPTNSVESAFGKERGDC